LFGILGLFHHHEQQCYPANYSSSGPAVPQPEVIEGEDPFRDDPARTSRTAEVFGTSVRR
jgi:hypothetical protein